MTDGVLPALLVLPVVGEKLTDPLVDLVERQPLGGGLLDGHADEGDVGIWRLGVAEVPSVPSFGFIARDLKAIRSTVAVPTVS